MADKETTDKDKADNPSPDSADAATATPASADKAAERFVLDFPDRESAEKGFKELQGYATKLSMERAKMEAKLEAQEEQLQKVQQRQSSMSPEDLAKADAELIAKIQNAENPYAELVKLARGMTLDAIDFVKGEMSEKEKVWMARLEEADGRYQANKAEVDRLMKEYDMPRKAAIRFVENELKAKADAPKPKTRAEVPSNLRSTASAGVGEDDGEEVQLPAFMLQNINAMGLPDENKKRMIAEIKKELKAERRVA